MVCPSEGVTTFTVGVLVWAIAFEAKISVSAADAVIAALSFISSSF